MSLPIFYCNEANGHYLTLDAEESRHCVKVLRLHQGDEIEVVDGRGNRMRCSIAEADARACMAEVIERRSDASERPFYLHLAVAPTKNSARLEWLVEKAVEMGVDEITPIICAHSERHVQKGDRLTRIAISAMKQSQRATLPIINEATPLRTFVDALPEAYSQRTLQRMVCYCEGDQRRSIAEVYTAHNDVIVMIGPEGDFAESEIEGVIAHGFIPITLGNTRLRTETAALYATAALNFCNE